MHTDQLKRKGQVGGNTCYINLMCCAGLGFITQSCLTFCDPMDCSPPGASVLGDFPGQNTGVGCHAFLRTQRWNLLHLLHWQVDSLSLGFPCGSAGKESSCNAADLVPSLGWEDPLKKRKEQLLTPVFWPGEFHGSATNTWSSLES